MLNITACMRLRVSIKLLYISFVFCSRLWDPNNLQIAATFPCKQYIQTHCELSLDGRYCVTSSNGFEGTAVKQQYDF